jgi:hypothetical protein
MPDAMWKDNRAAISTPAIVNGNPFIRTDDPTIAVSLLKCRFQ